MKWNSSSERDFFSLSVMRVLYILDTNPFQICSCWHFSHFVGCFFTQMMVSFAAWKCFTFVKYNLLFFCCYGYTNKVLFRKYFPVLLSSSVFQIFSIRLREWSLMLRSFIPVSLKFMQGEIGVQFHSSTYSFPVWPAPSAEEAIFFLLCIFDFFFQKSRCCNSMWLYVTP